MTISAKSDVVRMISGGPQLPLANRPVRCFHILERSRPEEKERSSAQQNQSHGDRPRRLWLTNLVSGLAKRGAALGGRMVRIHLPQRRVA